METHIEDDPFASFNETTAIHFKESFGLSLLYYIWIFSEILKFFLCIAVVTIDILLIITIGRTPKLRHCRLNKYILFYAIAHSIYMTSASFLYILLTTLVGFRNSEIYCQVLEMDHSLFMLCFLLGLCPGIEWYLTYYKTDIHQKLKDKYLKIILITFSVILILHVVWNQFICMLEDFLVHEYSLTVSYLIAMSLIASLNLLKCRNVGTRESERTGYYMHISTYVVCCWIPSLIVHFFNNFNEKFLPIGVLFQLSCLGELFAFSGPIFVLVILLKRNKYYRMAFDRIFRKAKVRNYHDDDLNSVVDESDGDLETESQPSRNEENRQT